MSKINIDRFICDFLSIVFDEDEQKRIIEKYEIFNCYSPLLIVNYTIKKALKQQGLEYRDGQLEEIRGKQEKISPNKPQTIKFNKERLMEIAKPESIEERYNIDIDKMVEEYKERILISQSLKYDDLLVRAIAYKQGLEDMLKLIRKEIKDETTER